MKKQILILSLLLAPAGNFAHAETDPQLESVIQSVANGFYTRDAQKVQKFIHPQHGYIYWYRIGIPTIQTFENKSDFNFPSENAASPDIWFFNAPNASQKLIQSSELPTMECDLWNKSGWYYQQHSHKKPFSELIYSYQKNNEISKTEMAEQLHKIQPFESNLAEMQYVGKTRNISDDLHLFFSKIEGKWYLSAFDQSGNCDA